MNSRIIEILDNPNQRKCWIPSIGKEVNFNQIRNNLNHTDKSSLMLLTCANSFNDMKELEAKFGYVLQEKIEYYILNDDLLFNQFDEYNEAHRNNLVQLATESDQSVKELLWLFEIGLCPANELFEQLTLKQKMQMLDINPNTAYWFMAGESQLLIFENANNYSFGKFCIKNNIKIHQLEISKDSICEELSPDWYELVINIGVESLYMYPKKYSDNEFTVNRILKIYDLN